MPMSLLFVEGMKESDLFVSLAPSVVLLLIIHRSIMSMRAYCQKLSLRKKQQ